jgi:hypothetical protein
MAVARENERDIAGLSRRTRRDGQSRVDRETGLYFIRGDRHSDVSQVADW